MLENVSAADAPAAIGPYSHAVIAGGLPAEVRANPDVQAVYLGGGH